MGEKRVAILGAGAAGAVTAAWLVQKGCEVIWWDQEEQCRKDFAVIGEKGIQVEGPGLTSGLRPAVLTHRLEEAMEAERVLVCVSSGRQEETAALMAPYVKSNHDLLLIPGNLGSVAVRRVFEKAKAAWGLLAELGECPWACRRLGPGHYVSAMPPGEKRIAALGKGRTEEASHRFGDLFFLRPGAGLAENCLNSPNVLTHLPGVLLNLGGIAEKGEGFALFTDGFSDGYIRCVELLEQERGAVLKRAGMECYSAPVGPFLTMLRERERHPELQAFCSLSGPDGLGHRYVTEDASCGMAFLVSLGRRLGVSMPVTEALFTLAGKLSGTDFYSAGRTLEWLGKDGEDVF